MTDPTLTDAIMEAHREMPDAADVGHGEPTIVLTLRAAKALTEAAERTAQAEADRASAWDEGWYAMQGYNLDGTVNDRNGNPYRDVNGDPLAAEARVDTPSAEQLIGTRAGLALANLAWEEGAGAMLRHTTGEHEEGPRSKPANPYSAAHLRSMAEGGSPSPIRETLYRRHVEPLPDGRAPHEWFEPVGQARVDTPSTPTRERVACSTPGCTGDGAYSAPGRGHAEWCRNPFPAEPAPSTPTREQALADALFERFGGEVGDSRVWLEHARAVIASVEHASSGVSDD